MTKSDTNEAAGRHSLREWQDNALCFWTVWRREEARLAALEDPVAFVTEANNLLHEYCPGGGWWNWKDRRPTERWYSAPTAI